MVFRRPASELDQRQRIVNRPPGLVDDSVCRVQVRVGDARNPRHAVPITGKNPDHSEQDKGQQERVFDQVLTLIFR